jgi:plastocyanin
MFVRSKFSAVLIMTLVLGACGGSEQAATAETSAAAPAGTPVASEAPAATASATGQVIEVRMTMANGGRFEPDNVTANPGDVIRFVNVENVHNISFPAAKNAGFASLPAASPYLTAPGATWDLVVDFAPGTYTFQCDPHVPMGMFGTLTVTQ